MKEDLSVQFFILIQLAQDEMVSLYNCSDAMKGKGYYYDVEDEFNKAWKKLNRAVPKGEYDKYRDVFCEAADGMDGEIAKLRDWFKGECDSMFDGSVSLLTHLVTAKFLLRSADYVFGEMYGHENKSKLVRDILAKVDSYARKFSIHGKGKGWTIEPDIQLVKEFNDMLINVSQKC